MAARLAPRMAVLGLIARRLPVLGIGRALAALLWGLLIVWPGLVTEALAADPAFPALTGRVVDGAGLLDAEARQRLSDKLAAFEAKTSDQIVVATVPSLDGLTIEDYANRLFRHWTLGTKEHNNGVLLIVAPNERKVRIEVGYGLEGALTDALSKVIITTAITPKFKQGDFAGGIEAGVDAIVSILTGDAEEWQRRAKPADDTSDEEAFIHAVIFIVVLGLFIWMVYRSSRGGPRGPGGRRSRWVPVILPGGFSDSGGGWSGGDGGGFSGGGGWSGGGGASGDW